MGMYMGSAEGELALSEVEKLSSVARSVIAGPGQKMRPEGEYFVPVEPNSFGVPSIDTCPGSTPYCEQDCYAVESEKRTDTYLKLQRNLDILNEAGTRFGMFAKLSLMMDRYRVRADNIVTDPTKPEGRGIDLDKRRFRIHWSGDFFSSDYALAWRAVIDSNPEDRYYTYTRSFTDTLNVLPLLSGLPNLDLFISVDFQNVDQAAKVLPNYPDVKVAYLVDYLDDAEELIEKLGRDVGYRKTACPENMRYTGGVQAGQRKLPVISKRGGACSRCTYCIGKPDNWDVIFVKTGYKTGTSQLPFTESIEISRRQKRVPVAFVKKVGQAVVPAETPTLFDEVSAPA